jgi:hypothetical protein
MLDGIGICGPEIVMGFKMKTKIWAEMAWDGRA